MLAHIRFDSAGIMLKLSTYTREVRAGCFATFTLPIIWKLSEYPGHYAHEYPAVPLAADMDEANLI